MVSTRTPGVFVVEVLLDKSLRFSGFMVKVRSNLGTRILTLSLLITTYSSKAALQTGHLSMWTRQPEHTHRCLKEVEIRHIYTKDGEEENMSTFSKQKKKVDEDMDMKQKSTL